MFRKIILSAPLVVATTLAQAANAPPAMRAYVEANVMSWANSIRVIEAIKTQNAQTAGTSEAQMVKLDKAWREQIGQADQPLISEVMSRDLSAFLSKQVEAAGGRITEIFVMDALGLKVAASNVTTDYWQGGEPKHTNSFGAGAGAVFVDAVKFDESAQGFLGQISVSLSDPATGEVVGAMTIGLNAQAFC